MSDNLPVGQSASDQALAALLRWRDEPESDEQYIMDAIALLTPIETNIVGCARCGGDGHEGLTFSPLDHPVELADGTPALTHWCPCPTNGQPILLCKREGR